MLDRARESRRRRRQVPPRGSRATLSAPVRRERDGLRRAPERFREAGNVPLGLAHDVDLTDAQVTLQRSERRSRASEAVFTASLARTEDE
jgi:hypothetical protein